jgi:addiction module toxin, txe/yoeB family
MKKIWSQEAWKDYLYWQENDKNILKRINKLILDIERNGYDCIGKPEALKGNFIVAL